MKQPALGRNGPRPALRRTVGRRRKRCLIAAARCLPIVQGVAETSGQKAPTGVPPPLRLDRDAASACPGEVGSGSPIKDMRQHKNLQRFPREDAW